VRVRESYDYDGGRDYEGGKHLGSDGRMLWLTSAEVILDADDVILRGVRTSLSSKITSS
jgi:hypothetical protein